MLSKERQTITQTMFHHVKLVELSQHVDNLTVACSYRSQIVISPSVQLSIFTQTASMSATRAIDATIV